MDSYDPAVHEAEHTEQCSAPKRGRGRPPKIINNLFHGFIGPATDYGQYPAFAMDIICGIARLDWHDRPIGVGGSSKPLSVKRLVAILAELEVISAQTVMKQYRMGLRNAQRYVKAVELAMPYLLMSRPDDLLYEMRYGFLRHKERQHSWEDQLPPPNPTDLEKLHRDLGITGDEKEDLQEFGEAWIKCRILL